MSPQARGGIFVLNTFKNTESSQNPLNLNTVSAFNGKRRKF